MPVRVVRLTAPWCKPCQSMGEVMKQVAAAVPHVQYEVVDTDVDPTLQLRHRASLPSLLIYDSRGEFHQLISGLQPAASVIKTIKDTP